MKYWVHKNNNRVGAHPTKPSDDWREISYATYCKEYALEHDGKLPAALPEEALIRQSQPSG